MADQNTTESSKTTDTLPAFRLQKLYVKDLSFESPSVPQSLQGPGQNPQLRVGVNVNAAPRGEDAYEVALQLEVHASSDLENWQLVGSGSIASLSQDGARIDRRVLFRDRMRCGLYRRRSGPGYWTRKGGLWPWRGWRHTWKRWGWDWRKRG